MQSEQATAAALTRRRPHSDIAGWLLLAMLAFAVLRGLVGDAAMWLAGASAWVAALVLWSRIAANLRIQVVTLMCLGVGFAVWGMMRGASVSIEQAVGQNQMILAMLAAVSFLKLINRPLAEGERIPAGRGAFARTLFGLHVFGAAINITAVVIIGDRLAAQARFGALQAAMISRGFCLSVLYSPFIGGMALALAMTPGSRLEILAAAGIPYAALGLVLTYWLLARRSADEIDRFKGYPIHPESLALPALLAVCVALLHRGYPQISVLTLISVSAPALVALVLLQRGGPRDTVTLFARHVRRALPEMSGELLLFLSAGVFAAGLTTLFTSFGDWSLYERFDGYAAASILFGMVALSVVGIHPIICVSFLAPLLAPIEPEPNLLALAFVMGWAIGCTVSPFSGTNLTMQGRYGVSSWSITLGNLGYAAAMVLAGSVVLILFDSLYTAG